MHSNNGLQAPEKAIVGVIRLLAAKGVISDDECRDILDTIQPHVSADDTLRVIDRIISDSDA